MNLLGVVFSPAGANFLVLIPVVGFTPRGHSGARVANGSIEMPIVGSPRGHWGIVISAAGVVIVAVCVGVGYHAVCGEAR